MAIIRCSLRLERSRFSDSFSSPAVTFYAGVSRPGEAGQASRALAPDHVLSVSLSEDRVVAATATEV